MDTVGSFSALCALPWFPEAPALAAWGYHARTLQKESHPRVEYGLSILPATRGKVSDAPFRALPLWDPALVSYSAGVLLGLAPRLPEAVCKVSARRVVRAMQEAKIRVPSALASLAQGAPEVEGEQVWDTAWDRIQFQAKHSQVQSPGAPALASVDLEANPLIKSSQPLRHQIFSVAEAQVQSAWLQEHWQSLPASHRHALGKLVLSALFEKVSMDANSKAIRSNPSVQWVIENTVSVKRPRALKGVKERIQSHQDCVHRHSRNKTSQQREDVKGLEEGHSAICQALLQRSKDLSVQEALSAAQKLSHLEHALGVYPQGPDPYETLFLSSRVEKFSAAEDQEESPFSDTRGGSRVVYTAGGTLLIRVSHLIERAQRGTGPMERQLGEDLARAFVKKPEETFAGMTRAQQSWTANWIADTVVAPGNHSDRPIAVSL